MRRLLAATLSLLLFPPLLRAAPPDGDPLAHLRSAHPRLLFTDDALAKALAAAKVDPLRAALHQRIIATAESILTAPPVQQPNEKNAPEQDRYAVYYILHCAMAYRLTGDERFLTRAKADLLHIASLPDWDPGHFLSVGEMSVAESLGYDWLYPRLTPDERATIKKALLEKSLAYADGAYSPHPTGRPYSWAAVMSNHNQVGNAGLLSAALALADEQPDLARKVIAGFRESLPRGMAAYAPDGAYPEGPGYWTYGTTYTAIALAELETSVGTDFGLDQAPGFNRTAIFYQAVQSPTGPVFNYADSSDDLQVSPARTWLAERFNLVAPLDTTRTQLADFIAHNDIIKFNRAIQSTVINRVFPLHAVWFPTPLPEDKPAPPLPLDMHFRGVADIALFRSAWNDPRALFIGFKAGENADHHNHLDLGSFVLDADGQRWALDFGPDTYELPNYFDYKNQRWSYFRTSNHGHNTTTPANALQQRHITAPITTFLSTPNRAFAIADLTPAYPDQAVSLHRGIALLNRAQVLIQDEFQPKTPDTPLHWQMATHAKIDLTPDARTASLTLQNRTLRIELLDPPAAAFRISSATPPTPPEKQNEGASLLTIDTSATTPITLTRMIILLTPLGDHWPQPIHPPIQPLADWH